jgi:hypothetical protein
MAGKRVTDLIAAAPHIGPSGRRKEHFNGLEL